MFACGNPPLSWGLTGSARGIVNISDSGPAALVCVAKRSAYSSPKILLQHLRQFFQLNRFRQKLIHPHLRTLHPFSRSLSPKPLQWESFLPLPPLLPPPLLSRQSRIFLGGDLLIMGIRMSINTNPIFLLRSSRFSLLDLFFFC